MRAAHLACAISHDHPRSYEDFVGARIKSGLVSQLIERLMRQDFTYIAKERFYRLVNPVIDATLVAYFESLLSR